MNREEILSYVDHTLLKPEATWNDIKIICDEAKENKTASICINPIFVKRASQYLKGKIKICTVIGFPLGATTTETKMIESKNALENGAQEFDMVINIGALKAGEYSNVLNDIKEVKKTIGDNILKVIIETCLLTNKEKEIMCDIVCEAGADYIKTSTGFSIGGATFDDIELFDRCIKGRCKIKAAGGIKSVSDMEKFIELGASRLGTSSVIKILNNMDAGSNY